MVLPDPAGAYGMPGTAIPYLVSINRFHFECSLVCIPDTKAIKAVSCPLWERRRLKQLTDGLAPPLFGSAGQSVSFPAMRRSYYIMFRDTDGIISKCVQSAQLYSGHAESVC